MYMYVYIYTFAMYAVNNMYNYIHVRCVALFYNTPPNLYSHVLTTCSSGVVSATIHVQ